MRRSLVVFGLFGLVLAGCNGGYYNNNNNLPQCTPPTGVQTVMVYPAPNATGVPDNFGIVVLASSSTLSTSYSAYVVNDTTQNALFFNQLGTAPNPLPTPRAAVSFANPVYQTSGNPGGVTFVPGSSITVYLNNNLNCNPTLSLGTFTVK